jgi:hypothetical protein
MDNHKVLGEKIADASNLADELGIDLHPRDVMPESVISRGAAREVLSMRSAGPSFPGLRKTCLVPSAAIECASPRKSGRRWYGGPGSGWDNLHGCQGP